MRSPRWSPVEPRPLEQTAQNAQRGRADGDLEESSAERDEHAERIRPFLDELGARVLYFGDCSTTLVAPEGHRWDAVLVVEYPSRRAFSEMVANPDYQQITALRTAALDEAVLQATVPWRE